MDLTLTLAAGIIAMSRLAWLMLAGHRRVNRRRSGFPLVVSQAIDIAVEHDRRLVRHAQRREIHGAS